MLGVRCQPLPESFWAVRYVKGIHKYDQPRQGLLLPKQVACTNRFLLEPSSLFPSLASGSSAPHNLLPRWRKCRCGMERERQCIAR